MNKAGMRRKRRSMFLGRYRFVLLVFGVFAAALLARTTYLHVLEGEFLRQEGKKRFLRAYPLAANRGMITDRHGEPLAVSTPVISLWCNPKQLGQQQQHWQKLADALQLPLPDVAKKLQRMQDREFMYLRRHVSPGRAEQVLALEVPGVYGLNEYRRYYPAGEVTAHVVGFTNIDDQGQEGIELLYDRSLKGEPGKYRVVQDRYGRAVQNLGVTQPPSPGGNLTLTIDLRMQYLAYRLLKEAVRQHAAQAGTVVAVDIESGEVLAMVNQPSYNPNNRKHMATGALRNRAATDLVEPGSTVKPFTVAAALETGLVTPATMIDTRPGTMRVGRKMIKDHRDYGIINVATVITKSSNVGTTKLALDLESPENLVQLLRRFGLGELTEIGFPGEGVGRLPMRPRWRPIELATLSYGYGLAVTPLQLVRAYAGLANEGETVPLSLVRGANVGKPEQVLNPRLARQLTAMLETVVSDQGTARRARISGYQVAGKTGTVHKVGSGGYQQDRYLSMFAGFAPASAPRIAMVVLLDDPTGGEHFGGAVAAPVFADIMRGMLRIKAVAPDNATPLAARAP